MSSFAKVTHIFSEKNFSVYSIFSDQSFNDTLTNDIVSFEQLGTGYSTPQAGQNLHFFYLA